MKIFSNILLVLLLALSVVGCNKTAEDNTEQRDKIKSYLTSSHSPKLIAWGDETIEDEPAYYFTSGSTTFMYISTYYDIDRQSRAKIERGSNISIKFTLYNFENITTPTTQDVLYTNDAIVISELVSYGLNPQYYSTDPKSIKVGDGALFGGVESMLVGCHEGDKIEFYMTLDEAYGSDVIGLSKLDAPAAFFCEVLTVN